MSELWRFVALLLRAALLFLLVLFLLPSSDARSQDGHPGLGGDPHVVAARSVDLGGG